MSDQREPVKILVFSASLRAESLNTRLATLAAASIERHGATADLASMRDFDAPSYDGDLEAAEGMPPGPQAFRERLAASHGFVIASPEYNASIPGVIKNAIDWVSRARPHPFNERHGLLVSASPSMVGGNRSEGGGGHQPEQCPAGPVHSAPGQWGGCWRRGRRARTGTARGPWPRRAPRI